MSIDLTKSAFETNVVADSAQANLGDDDQSPVMAGNSIVAAALGLVLAAGFYGLAYTVPWAPLERYFLGHPVAVAATVLFWFAVAVLVTKWVGIVSQSNQLGAIRDDDLLPSGGDGTPASRWLEQNDAGHVARSWLAEIAHLPRETRQSHLVSRLSELLTRQSQRGSTKHLADDLRELSARDADAAHDSLGLVRIIVWAIPMLGFLGTVIGITQTRGGLDFSNGTAAVENLKSGLYVAFDTTALGLVLSVVAIFLQFPIERAEQRLLSSIDARVGHLVSAQLPSDEVSDNQTALIADLCRGVQAAVAESLDNQARLWRDTIDEAQQQWQSVHDNDNNKIAAAFEETLIPALVEHARCMTDSARQSSDRLAQECDRLNATLEQAQQNVNHSGTQVAQQIVDGVGSVLAPTLRDHAATLDESMKTAADNSETLSSQQQLLMQHYQALTETCHQADSISALQHSLDVGLRRLNDTNASIDRSVAAAAGDGMADAMRVLARAVDLLSDRLAEARPERPHPRRAA